MANTKRDGRRERFWRAVLKRQARSGLSVRAFCRQEELAESNFYAWRRTIAQRDRHQGAGDARDLPTSSTERTERTVGVERTARTAAASRRNGRPRQRNSAPAFVPVTIDDLGKHETAIGQKHDAAIVLERPDGLRLRFCESIEPDRLAAIVHALDREALDCEATS